MDYLTVISLIISYITLYGVVYFGFIYLFRSNNKTATLFHPNITIIIPAHNEEKNIEKCIKSIKEQDYTGRITIMVMDDGSTDRTREIVKKLKVKYIQASPPGKPQGKTKTVNKGVMLAKTSIIGVLDSDSYLDKNAIKEMIGEFENKEVGAVTPIVKVHQPRKIIELLQMIEYSLSMSIRKLTSNTDSLFITHGVGTLFRKKALMKVGLFKENTLTEDLNIGLKLITNGYKVKSSFKAIGYTVVPDNTKSLIKQRLRWTGGLFENTYWFRQMLFNKNYGNAGVFILPLNLAWAVISVYVSINFMKDLIKGLYYDLKDLMLTGYDWNYFITTHSKTVIQVNELTILGAISLLMFISFFTIISKQLNMSRKESIISYLTMPLYFTVYTLINAISIIITPIYMIKKSGKPWLSDKVKQ